MAGGDHTHAHNAIRNWVYLWCKKGMLAPRLEKEGLLHDLGTPDGDGRRPADVLAAGRGLLSGDKQATCLDIAIISPDQAEFNQAAASRHLAAAEAYSHRKRTYKNTAKQCEEAGLGFIPLVLERPSGAWSDEARQCMAKVCDAVHRESGIAFSDAQDRFYQHASILIQRHNASMVRRRHDPLTAAGDRQAAHDALARVVDLGAPKAEGLYAPSHSTSDVHGSLAQPSPLHSTFPTAASAPAPSAKQSQGLGTAPAPGQKAKQFLGLGTAPAQGQQHQQSSSCDAAVPGSEPHLSLPLQTAYPAAPLPVMAPDHPPPATVMLPLGKLQAAVSAPHNAPTVAMTQPLRSHPPP
eukprot:gene3863-1861_t